MGYFLADIKRVRVEDENWEPTSAYWLDICLYFRSYDGEKNLCAKVVEYF